MKSKKRKTIILVMSIILVVFGGIVLINKNNFKSASIDTNKLKTKVIAKNEEESKENTESKEKTIESSNTNKENNYQDQNNNVTPKEEVANTSTNVAETTPYYIATLKIPKIGLEKGLVPKDSPDNTLSKNVETLMESDYPDVVNGNLILAAHSGNMRISFFSRLLEIGVGDTAEIVYKGKTYVYRVNNIYDIPKQDMQRL